MCSAGFRDKVNFKFQLSVLGVFIVLITCFILALQVSSVLPGPTWLSFVPGPVIIAVIIMFTFLAYGILKQSADKNEKYKVLFNEAAAAIIITDRTGRFLEMNRMASDMLGYTVDELKKMTFADLLTKDELETRPPKYNEVKRGVSFVSVRKMNHKNGSVVHVEINASVLPGNRLMGVVKDVTGLKRLQKELEDYKNALDNATIVTMTDKEGVITHANDNFCKVSGYSREELIGKSNNIVNSGYHPAVYFQEFWQTIRSGKVWSGEIRNRAKDGSIFWVYATVVPFLDENGVPYKYAGIRQDITFRKEEKMRIDKAILQAQEKERNLIGMELHDNVSQLLSASLLYISAAANGTIASSMNDQLFARSREYILDAIKEIRVISHQLAPVTNKELSVRDLFESLCNDIRSVQRFEIHLDIGEIETSTFNVELIRNLYRIVQEQLNNIIKYAKAKNVRISLHSQDREISLCIADDGVGFDPRAIKSGIGLENIRRRTQLFDGSVQINTAPGKGCEVFIVLPVTETEMKVA